MGTYWEVEAALPRASEELWGLFCGERGARGAEWLAESAGEVVLRYAFDRLEAVQAEGWAAAFLRRFPGAAPPRQVVVRERAVEDWAWQWQRHFEPLPVGDRLLVCPPWHIPRPAPEGRIPLVILPGRGFGTGRHPSTVLALELLERTLLDSTLHGRPVTGLLDVGTGSGILALAGALLGAPAVRCLEIDPAALAEVPQNFARSGARPPTLVRGTPECLRESFALVVANITAPVLALHAARLAGLTAAGGSLILSGLLVQERDLILPRFAAQGMGLAEGRARDGWWACLLRRPSIP